VTKAFMIELALKKQIKLMHRAPRLPAYTIVPSLPRSSMGVQLDRRVWIQGNRKPYRQETQSMTVCRIEALYNLECLGKITILNLNESLFVRFCTVKMYINLCPSHLYQMHCGFIDTNRLEFTIQLQQPSICGGKIKVTASAINIRNVWVVCVWNTFFCLHICLIFYWIICIPCDMAL